MQQFTITQASPLQLEILQRIGRDTFFETFAAVNTAEDMQLYLDATFSFEKIHAELTNPHSLFYLAWNGDEPVGYLKLNFPQAQSDLKDESSLEIERIYVKAACHGKNVGQLLYEKAQEVAIAAGKSYIWLGVWEHNHRAIAFYTKWGFEKFGDHPFVLGADVQTDWWMRRKL